jgi:hypothetical protein
MQNLPCLDVPPGVHSEPPQAQPLRQGARKPVAGGQGPHPRLLPGVEPGDRPGLAKGIVADCGRDLPSAGA